MLVKLKKLFKIIIVNLGAFVLLIIFIEFLGHSVYFLKNGHFIFVKSELVEVNESIFEQHPYLIGQLKNNISISNNGLKVSTTNYHTRVTGAKGEKNNKIVIALLGGSTTFGTKVSDNESWPYLLQEMLGDKFYIINFGMPGYSTVEAIIQLAIQIPEFCPDIIINYHGWNDIHNYHLPEFDSNYRQHGMMQFTNLSIKSCEGMNNYSSILFLIKKIKQIINQTFGESQKKQSLDYDTPDILVDRIYARNIRTINDLSQSIAKTIYFVPQILNDSAYYTSTENDYWSPTIRDTAMPSLMKHFNILMKNQIDTSESIFIEEVLKVNWERDDFKDRGHFSLKGGIKFANIIKTIILSDSNLGSSN